MKYIRVTLLLGPVWHSVAIGDYAVAVAVTNDASVGVYLSKNSIFGYINVAVLDGLILKTWTFKKLKKLQDLQGK